MKKNPAKEYMTIRLDGDLRKKVEAMAVQENRTLTNMTIVLLQRAIEIQTQADARV